MKIVLFAAFLLLVLLTFLGLQKAVQKQAFSMGKRYLHFRFILVLLLLQLALFNYYLSSPLLKLLDWIINQPVVAKILNYMLPSRAYEVLYMLLITLGMNLLLLLGASFVFGTVKLLFGERNLYFLEDEDYIGWKMIFYIPHKLVGKFYDSTETGPVLNEKGHCMGKWAKGMKWIFAVIAIGQIMLLAGSVLWGNAQWNVFVRSLSKAWYWLPFAGFLLAGQIQLFLEDEIECSAGTFGSTEISSVMEGDIREMPRLYQATFADTEALICCKRIDGLAKDASSMTDDLGNQQVADCENGEVLTVLSKQLKECGVTQTPNYQNALAHLLDGKSINVCDKLEGEFFIYLTAYFNYILSQGQTVLLLCKSQEDAQHLKTVCEDNMRRLNNIGAIWTICTAKEAKKDMPMNLLVCSFDELIGLRLLEIRREFASVLRCAVITSGELLFSRDNIRIVRLFNELRMHTNGLQYVLSTDSDNDNLRTTMENFIGQQDLVPFNNAACRDDTYVMVWEEESCHQLQRTLGIRNDMSPHMGVAVPLALVAAKYDFPRIHIIPSADRPDETYWQLMSVNTLDIGRYLTNHADVNAVIRREPSEALEPQELKMMICYDTQYAFLNTIWGWAKYAGSKGTVLHIVSPHYLLREYFADNFAKGKLFLDDKEFEALVPHSRAMRVSNMIALLVDLWDKGMTEQALLQKSKEYGWSYKNAEEVLDACLAVVLDSEEKYNIFEHFRFEQRQRQLDDHGGFVTETYVTLGDRETYDRIIAQTRRATLQIGAEQRIELPILQRDITNYYLREQLLMHGGFCYKIDAIKNGTVFATQHSDRFIYDYYPVSQFSFSDYTVIDKCVDGTYLDLNIAMAKTTRDIYAYWKSNNGCRITDSSVFTIENLSDDAVREEKTVNLLEVNLMKSVLGEQSRTVAVTLAFILNGLFKTLFPYTHANLFAVVQSEDSYDDLKRIIESGSDNTREDIIKTLIPFTKGDAPVKADYETIYIVEYSCVEYGMVRLVYKNFERIMRMAREYLKWYLQPKQTGEETGAEAAATCGRNLHFGGADIPAVFAPQALLELLVKITGEDTALPEDTKGDVEVALSNTCVFCGRQALFMRKLSDGRKICNMCYDHQVTQREEIKELFVQTVQFMEQGYGIKLRKNIHVRFKSAEEILRETGGVAGGRILGFYRHRGHQLWMESRGPRVAMKSTLAHELTHSWQHDNLPLARLRRALPRDRRDELLLMLIEGHASYVEVETMREMHEEEFARRHEALLLLRDDEYGRGYRLIQDYFKEKKAEGSHMNVFTIMESLVEDIISRKVKIG